MVYEKPNIDLVGTAISAIQNPVSKLATDSDNPLPTDPAYEADE